MEPLKSGDRPWIWIYGLTIVVMGIAIGVFVWQAVESRREAGAGRTANAAPSQAVAIAPERIALLSRFEPPAYRPDATQAARVSPQFQRAMRHYSARDYASAIPDLRSLAEAGPQAIDARFYLGICYLLANDRARGLEELRSVIGGGSSPYLERARFYAVKGLLGAGDVEAAERELETLIAMHGDLEKQAEALRLQVWSKPPH